MSELPRPLETPEAEDTNGKYCPFIQAPTELVPCLKGECQLWFKTSSDPNEVYGCSFRFIVDIFVELNGRGPGRQ